MKTKVTAEPGQNIVSYERVFKATPEMLFRAHTEPKQLEQWWGVFDGITTEVEIFEPFFGGKWIVTSRGDDIEDYITFRGINHIVEPTKLVYTFEYVNVPGSVTLECIEFIAQGETTLLRGTTSFLSTEARDAMVDSGMEYGTEGSYKSLDSVLAKM